MNLKRRITMSLVGAGLLVCGWFLVVPAATAELLAEHPSELPPLTPEAQFPRCMARELALAGFPDHMHSWWWSGWEIMVDEQGRDYGPFSICDKRELTPRPGLTVADGEISCGQFRLSYNPAYEPCDLMIFLELLEWAGQLVPELLGFGIADTLTVISPDGTQQYGEMTGFGTWRLFHLDGNECIVQPAHILQARTLEGHAAFQLVTDWILRARFGDNLPPWLHQGLLEYISEDGVHLANYMAGFRSSGSVLFSAPLVDALLSAGVDPDPHRDREMYRRASYSAFLMVWELVENQGGLAALQEFLYLAGSGENLDEAGLRVYGVNMEQLALMLDAPRLGEPLGKYIQVRNPSIEP